jgi:hypothetical protein
VASIGALKFEAIQNKGKIQETVVIEVATIVEGKTFL